MPFHLKSMSLQLIYKILLKYALKTMDLLQKHVNRKKIK